MKQYVTLLIFTLLFGITVSAQVSVKELKKDIYQIDEQIIDLNVIDNSFAKKTIEKKFKAEAQNIIQNLKKSAVLVKEYKEIQKQNKRKTISSTRKLRGIKSDLDKIHSDNEILMVRMQNTMQQRSQVLTMVTQLLKSINDSSNSIAANIGR